MHRTLNHYRAGLLVPAKPIATVLVWSESLGFWWSCAPPPQKEISRPAPLSQKESQGQPSDTSDCSLIALSTCNQKDELAASIPNSLGWCFTLHPHWCPEHCRLWHVLRAGEEQNRDKDWATAWNNYQSPKHFSELFRYLPKIPVFCFQKKDVMVFLHPRVS